MDDLDGHKGIEEGLRKAFGEPEGSVLDAIERISGTRSRILLRESPDHMSPILRLVGPAEVDAAKDDSRYQILGEIARGGMGVVYRGRDKDLGRDVALKVLRPDLAHDGGVVQRFVEEAQVGGQLQHPGIVPIYSLGLQPDGRPYFAMKLVKGETLTALLEEGRKASDLLDVFQRVVQTMAYAHSRAVIHRDLKPSNVMVGAFGEVQVVDWGFAKVLGREEKHPRPGVTMVATVRTGNEGSQSIAGSVMGTPAYMPPEQAMGRIDDLTERSDVFALGAILCEILTRKPPYTGTTEDQLLAAAQARLEEAHARLDECAAPDELKQLARDCMAPLPKDRPKDAGAVAKRLADHLASVEERARQADFDAVAAAAAARKDRRARRVTIALSALALVAIVGGGGGYWAWSKGERERAELATARVAPLLRNATAAEGAERWSEALGAATAALALARADGADEETLSAAHNVHARIEAGAAAAAALKEKLAREAKLIDALDELVMQGTDLSPSKHERRYKAAFAEFGVDPEATEAAAALRGFGQPVELAAHLDRWARLRRDRGNDAWRTLDRLARALDPDPWRTRLRDTAPMKDTDTLRVLAASPDVGEQQPATLELLADALVGAGDAESAVMLLRQARVRHPEDFWTHHRLARILWWVLHRPVEAAAYAEVARALRPKSFGAWVIVGAIRCDGFKDYDGAVQAFRQAVLLNPNSAGARGNLGNAFRGKGEFAAAAAEYREAIRLDPSYASAHHNLGVVLNSQGDKEGANAEYREAIRLDPDEALYRSNLGSLLSDEGDVTGALAELREAIRLDPRYADAHGNLGRTLQKAGDAEGAIAEYREAIRLDPDNLAAYIGLSNVLKEKDDVPGQIAAYREILRLDPDHLAVRRNLGALLCDRLGRYDEAIAEFREVLRIDAMRVERERRRRAGQGSVSAVELAAQSLHALHGIGVAYGKKGDLEGAVEEYRGILRLHPDWVEAHTQLGFALQRKGDLDGAIAEHREAVRLGPGNAPAHEALGEALMAKDDPAGAITEFRETIRLDPKLAIAHAFLGAALRRTGDFDASLQSFREAAALNPRIFRDTAFSLALAERLASAHARLPAVLRGEEEPATGEEWAEFATVCYRTKDYANTVRLWKRAFAKEPGLANDLDAGHRYNAACAAALAGAEFHGDALAWLRADLEMRRAMVTTDPATVAENLRHWKRDADFASVRDGGGPTAEWRKLWADVDALIEESGR